MSSITDLFADLNAALEALGAVDWDGLAPWDRVGALEQLESVRRRATACSTDIVASVERCADSELGGIRFKLIADVLRITPREARRRMHDAAQLQPRTTLTGQQAPPELPATAKAWNAGLLDVEHLRVIQRFFRDLPLDVPPGAAEKAEAFLAEKAAELRPDQLEVLADRLALDLNPDGRFSDEYRARQRGFAWCGRQRTDGMSTGRAAVG